LIGLILGAAAEQTLLGEDSQEEHADHRQVDDQVMGKIGDDSSGSP
jgi:hypothetical protein